MGGCTFVLDGDTPAEVKRKLNAKLLEVQREGLFEDRKSRIRFDPKKKKHYQVLRVHT